MSIGLVVLGGLAWALSSFAAPQLDHPANPDEAAFHNRPDAAMSSSEGPLLAARYHLRNRTQRFFQRSTSPYRRSNTIKSRLRPAGGHRLRGTRMLS
jgi:hypothetical protein